MFEPSCAYKPLPLQILQVIADLENYDEIPNVVDQVIAKFGTVHIFVSDLFLLERKYYTVQKIIHSAIFSSINYYKSDLILLRCTILHLILIGFPGRPVAPVPSELLFHK